MIACIIEFTIKTGQEAAARQILDQLMVPVQRIDGFISKESFESRDTPGKMLSVSYWRDTQALEDWNADRDHVIAMMRGKREIYSHFTIRISEVARERSWEAEP